jgi:hypothetical protein
MHCPTVARAGLAALLTASLSFVAVMPSATALPPRPGCGFGDLQHSHQAAPGLDPLGLRPGRGTGDENHPHTAPPGQAPDGAGDQSNPRRGCPDSPLG